ncbi:MAG: YdcH family protein [Rhodocyclales bacterium]|nr:YdcH family protein [Rhodocyclales bacterium]
MELQQHDLHHEFPEYRDAIHQLKTVNHHFAKLFDDYHRVNRDIRRIEENEEPVADFALEEMKKQRLKLKDELHAMLRDFKS